ncbi:ankyrin repeat and MYND domain-containing protein 1 isoform X6 [Vicugna pacos]|uniref:Ankyrin repeat and MYND domain-containing protein 1 isoform X6 n=1 Tax=Vicugna pacos TaxID=30538 RepID=A0ABM5DB23_VICPA
MEGYYSSPLYYESPDVSSCEDQTDETGREPGAVGTLESPRLGPKRFAREAPEEEEESGGPLREQGLKEVYTQLVRGVQEWQDGCVYRGEFGLDMKLGCGEFSWPTGEGLYKADERFGPGIETYPDGSQDVGLWFRAHLIKLCEPAPGGFSIRSYPEFSGFLSHTPARISLADEEKTEWPLHEGKDPFFYDYKRFLLNDSLTLPPEMHVYSTDSGHLPMTSSFRKDLDAHIFLNDIPPFVEDGEPWFIKNETPLMVKIQKQAYKFRNKKAHTSWNMGAVLDGNRGGFAHHGPKERLSKEMILKAQEGNYDWVYGILRDNFASPDVADATGYTVLAAAAVHCHIDIVNLLLDSGADVNRCTDEGLTPLSMCFLLYYPTGSFKSNIAERTVPEPQEAAKTLMTPSRSFSLSEAATEPVFQEELVPASGGQEPKPLSARSDSEEGSQPPEDGDLRSSASDLGKARDAASGALDRCTPCSDETDFKSNRCVRNFCIKPSQELLEKGAQAHGQLKAPAAPAGSDKGTVRRMAPSVVQRRNRWLTIRLLLQRGADPNLSRVPMQALFFAVKAADVDGVRLLLESGARTDIQFPPELGALTPLHIAAALPGEEGVKITELLLHAITDVDARAADQDDVYRQNKIDLLPSSLKLNNEAGPPSTYYGEPSSAPDEGGRTALHVACEREDNHRCARDIVRLLLSHGANPNTLWSGHSPLSLSIASGNDLIVKELLSHGADPNLLLTRGLGSALCVACDLTYESQRSVDSRLALVDRLINHGADILNPVTLVQGDKVAVGTAVDYGYFRFYQDRKIAHCPFHTLMPAEREMFLARRKLLEYMGLQLRRAVFAKESQWDPKVLHLSKRVELAPSLRLKRRSPSPPKELDLEDQELIPFFKFCCQCGRSVGVRLSPCTRCYGVLTCSKHCRTRAWADFHRRACGALTAFRRMYSGLLTRKKPLKHLGNVPGQKTETLKLPHRLKCSYSTYNQE